MTEGCRHAAFFINISWGDIWAFDMTERLKSLDIFRGITVAAMIMVNNPGSWDDDYPPLLHSQWSCFGAVC